MAKGRRYRAERLLAPPAHSSGGSASGRADDDLPDLSEGDCWPDYHPTSHDDSAFADDDVDDCRDQGQRTRHPHAQRWVQRHVGGLTLAFESLYREGSATVLSERHRAVAASAPVDVPVWQRSFRSGTGGPTPKPEEEDEEEDDSPDGGWLPPHEYLARTRGRSMATSVLEGAGRTLKGRDMSRVRDAVWSQTGFFG